MVFRIDEKNHAVNPNKLPQTNLSPNTRQQSNPTSRHFIFHSFTLTPVHEV